MDNSPQTIFDAASPGVVARIVEEHGHESLFFAEHTHIPASRATLYPAGVVERDPIIAAKEAASVDHLSGGRLEFGVGAGWNREEEASYQGEFVRFEGVQSWPKPAQRPSPVLVGGNGPTAPGSSGSGPSARSIWS